MSHQEREHQLDQSYRVPSSEGSVGFQDDEAHLIDEYLQGSISMDAHHFERNPISPTPLHPSMLTVESSYIDYSSAALAYMHGRHDARLFESGVQLPLASNVAIEAEINTAHAFQVEKNGDSMQRLLHEYSAHPESFSLDTARTIYDERCGHGSTENRLKLLSTFPGIGSIEDMKMTAPLDGKKILLGQQQYYAHLHELANTPRNDIDIQFVHPDKQKLYLVDVSKSAHPGVFVTKRIPVTAKVGEVELLLKQKDSYVALPPDLDLGDGVQKLIVKMNGQVVNMQQISTASYWVVVGRE